ncbi:unnamed protein product [Caenorhabditis bovis]|uniref:Origin recognition complex subunit 5 C-terminal domain-containing protein n=1 Tax=Caenorhabditis bovis TaxID=2654633 RepID=A0A8S1EZ92_9PELO|nr:unnamed protein product [Caenorhabditis bovis]
MDKNQIHRLKLTIFNKSRSIGHVHVFGDSSNGRSEIVRQIIRQNHQNSWVCAFGDLMYAEGSAKLLLENLANELGIRPKSDKIEDFFYNVYNFADWPKESKKKQLLLFLDNAHAVVKYHPVYMRCFFNSYKCIPEMTVRFVTSAPSCWETYQTSIALGHLPIIQFHIRAPNEVNVLELILKSNSKMNPTFARMGVTALFQHCRAPNTLLSIISDAYKEYDMRENIDVTKVNELLKKAAEPKLGIGRPKEDIENATDSFESMPLSMRFLLLAAYCASNNAPNTDRRFFVKNHGRDKRSEKQEIHSEQVRQLKDMEPKTADLQRIICIYETLVRFCLDKPIRGFDVKNVLSSLHSMGLVTTTSLSNLDQPKIKCMLSLESAYRIAASLKVELRNYLEYTN